MSPPYPGALQDSAFPPWCVTSSACGRCGARCVPRRVLLLLCARSLRLPGSAAPLARRAEPLAPIQRLPYDDQWSSSLPFDWLTLGTNQLGRRWHLFLAGHRITELSSPDGTRGQSPKRDPIRACLRVCTERREAFIRRSFSLRWQASLRLDLAGYGLMACLYSPE